MPPSVECSNSRATLMPFFGVMMRSPGLVLQESLPRLKVISKYGIGLATGRIETLRPAVLQNLCVLWPANYAENRNFCDVAFKVTFRLERRRN